MALPSASDSATVVVTGASSGIGAELARTLAQRGHAVTLVARRSDRLEKLAAELRAAHGVTASVIACDLSDPAARAELAAQLLDGPQLAGLCNNAGFGVSGRFISNDAERERQMIEVNVDALHDLTIRLIGSMIECDSGAILNVASTAAFQPLPGFASYAATKAFVLSFSEALSSELKGSGVSCTVLCPGAVRTEFAEVAGSVGFEDTLPDFTIVTAQDVARQAVDAMERGRRDVVPGLPNRIQAIAGRIAPRTLLLPIVARLTRQ